MSAWNVCTEIIEVEAIPPANGISRDMGSFTELNRRFPIRRPYVYWAITCGRAF